MEVVENKVVPGILGTSFIIILWWVALWFIIEETIVFLAGNKRHLKLSICVIIIVIITIYAHHAPYIALKL